MPDTYVELTMTAQNSTDVYTDWIYIPARCTYELAYGATSYTGALTVERRISKEDPTFSVKKTFDVNGSYFDTEATGGFYRIGFDAWQFYGTTPLGRYMLRIGGR